MLLLVLDIFYLSSLHRRALSSCFLWRQAPNPPSSLRSIEEFELLMPIKPFAIPLCRNSVLENLVIKCENCYYRALHFLLSFLASLYSKLSLQPCVIHPPPLPGNLPVKFPPTSPAILCSLLRSLYNSTPLSLFPFILSISPPLDYLS